MEHRAEDQQGIVDDVRRIGPIPVVGDELKVDGCRFIVKVTKVVESDKLDGTVRRWP